MKRRRERIRERATYIMINLKPLLNNYNSLFEIAILTINKIIVFKISKYC